MNASTIRRIQAQDQMRQRMKARVAAASCNCLACQLAKRGVANNAVIPQDNIPEGLADLLGGLAERGNPGKAH